MYCKMGGCIYRCDFFLLYERFDLCRYVIYLCGLLIFCWSLRCGSSIFRFVYYQFMVLVDKNYFLYFRLVLGNVFREYFIFFWGYFCDRLAFYLRYMYMLV